MTETVYAVPQDRVIQNPNEDVRHFVSMIEHDMLNGTKRTYEDLYAYCNLKIKDLTGTWRHRESSGVYVTLSVGLACTGEGRIVPMVRYRPLEGAPVEFERTAAVFSEKFERVVAKTVWEKA